MTNTRPEPITPRQLHDSHRWIPLDEVALLPGNPNQGHTESLDASIDEFGWIDGIVIHKGIVIAGNHRVAKAQAAGETGLPGYDLSHLDLDDARRMAIALAHNHTTRAGQNDPQLLADAMISIADTDETLANVAGIQSLDAVTLDLIEQHRNPQDDVDVDEIPPTPTKAVTKPGDIWQIGPHRIICGSSHDIDTVKRLTENEPINVAFTSPPYADRRTYDETSGFKPIPPDEYVDWFEPIANNVAEVLADDGSWFVNIKPSADGLDSDTYTLDLVLAHARRWGWHWVTELCWERNGVPKSVTRRFKNQFEPVYHFALNQFKMRPKNVRHRSDNVPVPFGPGAGDTGWANAQGGNDSMMAGVRKRPNGTEEFMSDVQGQSHDVATGIVAGMAYPGNRLPTFTGTHEATGHTAAFPVGLPAFFVQAYTDPGDRILDPFLGSGSTIIAAHQHDRIGYGIELSPAYVDIAVARIQRITGITPKLNNRRRNMNP